DFSCRALAHADLRSRTALSGVRGPVGRGSAAGARCAPAAPAGRPPPDRTADHSTVPLVRDGLPATILAGRLPGGGRPAGEAEAQRAPAPDPRPATHPPLEPCRNPGPVTAVPSTSAPLPPGGGRASFPY